MMRSASARRFARNASTSRSRCPRRSCSSASLAPSRSVCVSISLARSCASPSTCSARTRDASLTSSAARAAARSRSAASSSGAILAAGRSLLCPHPVQDPVDESPPLLGRGGDELVDLAPDLLRRGHGGRRASPPDPVDGSRVPLPGSMREPGCEYHPRELGLARRVTDNGPVPMPSGDTSRGDTKGECAHVATTTAILSTGRRPIEESRPGPISAGSHA